MASSRAPARPSTSFGIRMIQPTSLGWRRKRLIAAYEEKQWPRRPRSVADLIRHLMDQHSLTRADLVRLLGTASRVSEVMRGKKGLSMAMVQRLRARFRVPADLLLPPPKKAPSRAA
jgi:hypothetical protein